MMTNLKYRVIDKRHFYLQSIGIKLHNLHLKFCIFKKCYLKPLVGSVMYLNIMSMDLNMEEFLIFGSSLII